MKDGVEGLLGLLPEDARAIYQTAATIGGYASRIR